MHAHRVPYPIIHSVELNDANRRLKLRCRFYVDSLLVSSVLLFYYIRRCVHVNFQPFRIHYMTTLPSRYFLISIFSFIRCGAHSSPTMALFRCAGFFEHCCFFVRPFLCHLCVCVCVGRYIAALL